MSWINSTVFKAVRGVSVAPHTNTMTNQASKQERKKEKEKETTRNMVVMMRLARVAR